MSFFSLEQVDHVTLLKLHHGEENRLHPQMIQALLKTLSALAEDETTHAVVFTSASEKYWCTGLDLSGLAQQGEVDVSTVMDAVFALLKQTLRFPKPLIAALNGHCFGLGAIWSLAFDFRLMRQDRGWFCIPAIDLGIALPPQLVGFLRTALPADLLHRLLWTGKRLGGEETLQLGITHSIHTKDQLLEAALEAAQQLGKKDLLTYNSLKQDLRAPALQALETTH
ncbi:MAG: enoyl-CoA hydratase/isomerase family protein [Myxococcales bacterium]|nr:enoyl-CoA hydratase/isomerase family protein [Myxococcales bacterium]MCB9643267.1 enoyl-CoA hydratase/isomerase family protein [Myxococcales bacterium]